ncbi:serine/threonine protein kinase [Ktedonospora formicarum]|uniref:Protein kinase domain-containing protein n=1 Tax=Ktedonospora formicarum TaxID=2778364 RepID=A0A8J3ICK1_9CHLR|nr:serine/threonine-protein kinase [Ktedonospora formicarum]GHO50197.1 hypothetical protein KSX_83600 [Ktedonospora formicarum]
MSLPLALAQGTIIGGHYVVGPLINSGGFGAVYRGIDTSENNRPCAIKETYDVTPMARRQGLMEAGVLFTVRNAHLPEVYDALEANGRFYLVMQLIEGRNLLDLLKSRVSGGYVGEQEPHQVANGPCSEQEVCTWLLPIMDVLQELHSRNPAIIHRDIKPGNIILTPEQTTVLVDFGLTKLYQPGQETQTLVKAVTAGFSPLEQYTGRTGPQSDIYSMAATMYLLLTNRLPPPAINRSLQDHLIPPRQLNPSLSTHMENMLLKALSIRAEDRFASMAEFARALRDPNFATAHSDATFAVTSWQAGSTVPQPGGPVSSPGYSGAQPKLTLPAPPPTPPAQKRSPAPVQRPPQVQAQWPRAQQPHGQQFAGQGGPHAQSGVAAGPGRQAQRIPTPHSAPHPFNQGCLWGIVQGILSALLILFYPREEYFYLAILMGFMFYVFAGFITTSRGGAALRGAWAGLWTGINSTLVFWCVLLVGIVVRWAQHMPKGNAEPGTAGRVWQEVFPEFLRRQTQAATNGQQGSPLLIWIIGGVVIAFVLGLLGGILGNAQFKGRLLRRQAQQP